ncbi:MAG: hypothetical protein AAF610_00025 [Pseudomonadota bacterium]
MNKKLNRRALWPTAVALTVTLLTGFPALAKDVQFTAASDIPIVRFSREHAMMRGVSDAPLVAVFGDGRVVVERPVYMKRPGRHEFALNSAELSMLLTALAPVIDLDVDALRRERDELARSSGQYYMTLDETVTHIELNFEQFVRDNGRATKVARTQSMADVQIHAETYPTVRGLVSLAGAEAALMGLFERPLAKDTEGARDE